MKKQFSRRQAIKTLGLTAGAAMLGIKGFSQIDDNIFEYGLNLD
jgi:hypothetical protein